MESLKLSAESAARAVEAAQAAAKRSQAGWDAALKGEKAAWGSELEGARFEVRGAVLKQATWDLSGVGWSLEFIGSITRKKTAGWGGEMGRR